MSLESHLQTLLDNQQSYQPGDVATQLLGEKELVMVVAPSSMGKSTVMNKVIEIHPDFARVLNATTRPKRTNDEPGLYQYIPHSREGIQQIVDAVNRRELVQYAIFPTTGFIYFTRPESYPATYNLLDTQSQVVEHLRTLPFRHTHTIGLVTDPAAWKKWLFERYSPSDPELLRRIQEAIHSLEWLLYQPEDTISWVFNYPDNTPKSAAELIEIVRSRQIAHSSYRQYAVDLLKLAQTLKG